MSPRLQKLFASRFWPLAIAFVLLNLVVTQDGGQNARSRLLTLRAMGDLGSFRLDSFLNATDDWALAPNGHHYSNKAPGAVLLGFPAFFVADKVHELGEKGFRDERGLRSDPGYSQATFTSFCVQVLPFALLGLAGAAYLSSLGISVAAQAFFLLAFYFGNTASLFLNSFFGHGLESLIQFAGLLALLRGAYADAGLGFSLALLTDYSFAFQIPGLVLAGLLDGLRWRKLLRFSLGAVPGAVLWISYHAVVFGSPFAIASKFQNPAFREDASAGPRLYGAVALPDPHVLTELLVGMTRGLILQQPWLYLAAAIFLLRAVRREASQQERVTGAFALVGLAGLLLFNAGFNGWHGGMTAGPRYLAGVLPCFALLAALVYDRANPLVRGCLWVLLVVGLMFRSFVYGGTLLAPVTPLWPYYWDEAFGTHRWTPLLRITIFWIAVGAGLYLSLRRNRERTRPV